MSQDSYFAEVESITILMRKVELKKQEAVKAKEEAAKGCNPILDRVEELTQMLLRAQEANDMVRVSLFNDYYLTKKTKCALRLTFLFSSLSILGKCSVKRPF